MSNGSALDGSNPVEDSVNSKNIAAQAVIGIGAMALAVCLGNPTQAQLPPPGVTGDLFNRPDFFEDGIDRMEEEIRQLQDPPSEPTLVVQDDLLQWQAIVVREAGFGVWMPQGAMAEEIEEIETADGQMTFDVLASHVASARYLAAHSPLSEAQQQSEPELLLAQVQDGIANRTNFKLSGDRPIAFDGRYPGREFLLQGDSEQLTFRVYAIGSQLIVLAGGQPTVQEGSEAVDTFLNSLQLLQ